MEGEDKDIWNVCDIDGLTGNVVATDKSRHVLFFQGGYVEVPDFSHAPSDKATLAFWMQVLLVCLVVNVVVCACCFGPSRISMYTYMMLTCCVASMARYAFVCTKQSAADNMGCPFSYAAGDVGGAFTFSNTKAWMLCVAGECGPMTSVSANDGQWHHIAVTWDSSGSTDLQGRGNSIIYMDGNPVWQGDVSKGKMIEDGGTVVLGNAQLAPGSVGTAATAFEGQLSDVIWYNRVLSKVDIQGKMMSHVKGNEAGAMLAFAMTQPDDELTTLKDSSPSEAVGVFKGDPAPKLEVPMSSRPVNW